MHWLRSLHPRDNLKVLGQMREMDDRIDHYHRMEKDLRPPFDEVGFGSEDMRYFFLGESYREFLRMIRLGLTPSNAATLTKDYIRECIIRWNQVGSKTRASVSGSYLNHYWEGTCDSAIEELERKLLQCLDTKSVVT